MEKYYGFVYLWENTHPEAKKYKKYIGQHAGSIEDGYIGSGTIFQKVFYSKKYRGFWKRTILEYCNNQENLNLKEKEHIDKVNATNIDEYCNLREGGSNGKMHLESRKKMSIAAKGRIPWNKNIPMSEEIRQKLKVKLKGRVPWNKNLKGCYKLKDETKKRILESKKLFHNKVREQDYTVILKYIKQNGYAQRGDIPKILQRKISATIVTNRINDLVKQNKIKKLYLAWGHVHYILNDNL